MVLTRPSTTVNPLTLAPCCREAALCRAEAAEGTTGARGISHAVIGGVRHPARPLAARAESLYHPSRISDAIPSRRNHLHEDPDSPTMPQPQVVVCADRNIELGLHVTLYSLLVNASTPIKIYFIQKGYSDSDVARLVATLQPFTGRYTLVVIPFDDSIFESLHGLRGNRMPYVKLLLADLVPEERVVFLDSDLVVSLDIRDLFEEDLGAFQLGAVRSATLGWCLERDFFAALDLDPEVPYFSSGVMLLDLAGWRERKITEQCWEVARRHAAELRNTDQQVLNLLFYKQFKDLPPRYNHVLWPNAARIAQASGEIYHFGGVPKPWDLFGESVNNNSHLYLSVLEQTSFAGWRSWKSLRMATIRRFLRTPKYYFANLRKL
jgi:lipopolysaccharide biosynthesis glycosyltransferase